MFKKLLTKMFLIGSVLGAILTAGILVGCAGDSEPGDGADSGRMTASAGVSERGEGSGGEHGGSREGGGEHGSGGEGGAAGGEEGSGATLAPDETFDMLRAGARLILSYDAASNSFTGTVENTTSNVLTRVRIEVHLSNGTELGPTTPMDLAPGEVVAITLPSTQASFTGWVAHAEVGGGEGSESGGGEGGGESSEAAMSSPIIPLGQSWNGTLGGLAVSARFDEVTGTVHATVQNTLPQVLCYVQAEPHLKSGTRTVGELGPDVIGHLSPGQEATSSVAVASEPALAGVAYDGYVIHMEVFDCGGTGPVPHTGGEGAEGSGEGSGGEHGSGGEGSAEGGGESTEAGGEEGSSATLTLDEIFDMVRGGARLILSYDAASNSFTGMVENTTSNVLTRVRIEVHLSNGTELGPTTPMDLAPGEVVAITLPSTQASFTGWVAHAEVGSGERGESGGRESGGEHGSGGEGSGGG